MSWDTEGANERNLLIERCPGVDGDQMESLLEYDDNLVDSLSDPWYAIIEHEDGYFTIGGETMNGISKVILEDFIIDGGYTLNYLYNDGKEVRWKVAFQIHQPDALGGVEASPLAENFGEII